MNAAARGPLEHAIAGFWRGLSEMGFEEGRNVDIIYRFADGHYDMLPNLASDLVRHRVAVIIAGGGNVSARAAKNATSTIPIIFTAAADPVRDGLVASLARPGGNVTGNVLSEELDPKRLELLSELIPGGRTIGVLINPRFKWSEEQGRGIRAAADVLGRSLVFLTAASAVEIDAAFQTLETRRIDALMVHADPFLNSRRQQIVALATRWRIPAMYQWRDFVEIGGLMSYGPSLVDSYRSAGTYAGRILQGEHPANLPVLMPTRFELVINAKAAKSIGLALTDSILARADEVIE